MALTLLAGLLTSGCSSHDADEPGLIDGTEGVTLTVNAWSQALANGQGNRTCSLMDKDTQAALISETSSADCLSATAAWAKKHPQSWTITETDVAIDGDKATARYDGNSDAQATAKLLGSSSSLTLRRIESRWTLVTK
ncbi:hypothetical protein [Austwickia chelonae]|uniref:hypothetical protein n=1 Tax=Austwickia chelonae TaxID=100225 RepID=UPI0019688236|nr:hypothetical protein [Austwickia chelonae]